ncbi:TatD-related deoxyribonuclease [Thermoproteus uzoniensis 768-20]|uniref:TatD-related deoxyribonuclease n=1 Tax=Thermoproteus uzoniensis (strain 768-20) TaxID=999630 RepID=F2L3K1_THEU7|nr:TatD-related deoxyribonuclease [Thermoproteus uzoniensis 768-20]
MSLSTPVRVFDNHAHANELTGLGAVEVARRFKRAGGAGIIFVSLLTWSIGGAPGDRGWVEKLYEHTVKNSEAARGQGLISGAVVGVHPAECVKLRESGWGEEEVEAFMRWTVDLAARYVAEGRAVGFGEYGRPHWDVGPDVVALCNRVLEYVVARARDVGAVVHLHLERRGEETVRSVAEIARRANARPGTVVMHHVEPRVAPLAKELGLVPSVPVGRRGEFEEALGLEPIYVVESDYIDDNRRPGAVIPPWSLANKIRRAVERGLASESYFDQIYRNTESLYDVLLHSSV